LYVPEATHTSTGGVDVVAFWAFEIREENVRRGLVGIIMLQHSLRKKSDIRKLYYN